MIAQFKCPSCGREEELLLRNQEEPICKCCCARMDRVWTIGDTCRFEFRSQGYHCNDYGTGKQRLH